MDTPNFPTNSIPPKKTFVKKEPKTTAHSPNRENWDKSLEYRNNFGDDFGYFDRYGYEDRLYHRGYFRPTVRHVRVYNEDDDGSGYYYPVPSSSRVRVMHPEHLEERHIGSGGYSNLRYRDKWNNK